MKLAKRLRCYLIIACVAGFMLTSVAQAAGSTGALNQLASWLGIDHSPPPSVIKATGTIEVAFSPNNGVTTAVVKALDEARQSVLVSAYSFTSKEIAAALLRAKQRGVTVKLILDKSQVTQKYSSSQFFANQGFDQRIDYKHAIYHDKVMIIDGVTVITGSFNFTKAAETKNAENLLILRNNPDLAKLYAQDWWHNWNQALPREQFLQKYPSASRSSDE